MSDLQVHALDREIDDGLEAWVQNLKLWLRHWCRVCNELRVLSGVERTTSISEASTPNHCLGGCMVDD